MESDGRIRSKDIGTGEVNSRIINDIRSENYDGSHTDPSSDPGLNGWQLLKSGIFIASQAIIRGTIEAAEIISAIISGGEVNITSGGKLTVGGDADVGVPPLVTLDESGLTVGNAPVVIDETGLDIGDGLVKVDGDGMDIGNGLTVIDSSGVQVGTDVVIDSTGLKIQGVLQPAIDVGTAADTSPNVSLSSTWNNFATEVLTVPTWANSLSAMGTLAGQISGSAAQSFSLAVTTTASVPGSAGAVVSSVSGETRMATHPWQRTFVSPGATVTIYYWARVSSGTNSSNFFNAPLIWIATR